jgi:SHS2 domain-containing protein
MFEYLDHTADVQIHSWGATLEESFTEAGHALVDYMTSRTEIQPINSYNIRITAHDIQKLLYQFLDEILYHFFVDYAAHDIQITKLQNEDGCYTLEALVRGEPFDRNKHRCGCEVKAITYSNMSISLNHPFDIYVIIDI